MKSFALLLLTGCLMTSVECSAKVVLPSVFSDHMVLERNSTAAVWGFSDPGENIRVVGTWSGGDTIRTQATNDGHWRVDLPTGSAGGPYLLQIYGQYSMVTIQDVMLGEVWICSGQSNMEFTANWGLDNKAAEIAQADNPGIRFFHVPRVGAPYPQQDCRATWELCSQQTMPNTTAVGYYFARQIRKALNVPVGIIEAAWGGTPAEVWVRADRITSSQEIVKHQFDDHSMGWPAKEGVLYNGMISPVIPYRVAGALWYQGESNTHRPGAYAVLMDTLVAGWRRDFGQDFSFYFVQIAPFAYDTTTQAAVLREQQDLAQRMIPNSGMVSIGDLAGDIHDIHPKDKLDVGLRLANYALAETYHRPGLIYQSPSYKSMKVEGAKILLSFNHAKGGLVATGSDIPNFQIAGADGHFVDAKAEIKGDEILVSAAGVKAPKSVRYCFTNSAVPTVFLKKGHLPLAPFRTDSIKIDD